MPKSLQIRAKLNRNNFKLHENNQREHTQRKNSISSVTLRDQCSLNNYSGINMSIIIISFCPCQLDSWSHPAQALVVVCSEDPLFADIFQLAVFLLLSAANPPMHPLNMSDPCPVLQASWLTAESESETVLHRFGEVRFGCRGCCEASKLCFILKRLYDAAGIMRQLACLHQTALWTWSKCCFVYHFLYQFWLSRQLVGLLVSFIRACPPFDVQEEKTTN